jgi:hypothetical protein
MVPSLVKQANLSAPRQAACCFRSSGDRHEEVGGVTSSPHLHHNWKRTVDGKIKRYLSLLRLVPSFISGVAADGFHSSIFDPRLAILTILTVFAGSLSVRRWVLRYCLKEIGHHLLLIHNYSSIRRYMTQLKNIVKWNKRHINTDST